MRAVENDRWLLRDTNTGVTASIDPYGRVVASVPRKSAPRSRLPTRCRSEPLSTPVMETGSPTCVR